MDTKSLEESKCSSRTKEHEMNCKTRGWFDYGLGLHGSNWCRNLVLIEGIVNQYSYLNILKNNLSQSASKLGLDGSFTFQQDNDPKRTARVVREWLLYKVRKQQNNDSKHTAHNVKLWLLYNIKNQLRSSPQSLDLNPIEPLWDLLERKIRQHHITSKEMLKRVIVTEWNTISSEDTSKLVQSIPKRLTEVLRRKGYPTSH
ncbi:transposable element Tcb1 transposase [Trichonephila clavipes]|nr:transposable element Tcb1 transposase [Trichonephila clavipes]